MNHYSPRDYLIFGGLLFVGGGLGWLLGGMGWGFAVAMSVWVCLQHLEYVALRDWSERPLARPKFRTDAWQAAAETIFRSTRRQRTRTNQVLQQLRQMRAVTEALPDAAVMIDANGRIESFNPAAQTAFGIRTRDIGLHLTELARHPTLVHLLKHGESNEPVEMSAYGQEGVRLEVRTIIISEDRTLVLARNVTQLNRLLSMRQDFVANVSHELRTPLTVILGYLETLQEENLSHEAADQLISKLVPPAQRMSALVQDLLLLTRLESSPGLNGNHLSRVSMNDVVERAINTVEGLSDGRHEIRVEIDPDIDLLAVASEIESALGNLVANAIRYSPDGGVITVTWSKCGDGAELAVTDEGMGIGTEHLGRLTERFYRVDLARSRVQGGTGLGLAIVKHVLKRHQSILQIDSELGKGSRFYCRFGAEQLLRPNHTDDPIAVGSN